MRCVISILLSAFAASAGPSPWKLILSGGKGYESPRAGHCWPLAKYRDEPLLFDPERAVFTPEERATVKIETTVAKIGVIAGFQVFDVIHKFTNIPYVVVNKLILVKRSEQEYCAIFHSEYPPTQVNTWPSFLVEWRGEPVILGTRGRVDGTGGYFVEAYWTFDGNGPRPIAPYPTIMEALRTVLPKGLSTKSSEYGLDLRSWCYSNVVCEAKWATFKVGDILGSVFVKLDFSQGRLRAIEKVFYRDDTGIKRCPLREELLPSQSNR